MPTSRAACCTTAASALVAGIGAMVRTGASSANASTMRSRCFLTSAASGISRSSWRSSSLIDRDLDSASVNRARASRVTVARWSARARVAFENSLSSSRPRSAASCWYRSAGRSSSTSRITSCCNSADDNSWRRTSSPGRIDNADRRRASASSPRSSSVLVTQASAPPSYVPSRRSSTSTPSSTRCARTRARDPLV